MKALLGSAAILVFALSARAQEGLGSAKVRDASAPAEAPKETPPAPTVAAAPAPAPAPAAAAPAEIPKEAPKEAAPAAPAQAAPAEPPKEVAKAEPAKPEPAKAEPAPIQGAAPSIGAVKVSPAERLASEWRFLKQAGEDRRPEIVETVLAQVSRLVRSNPDADFADEALRLKADLFERQGDPKSAVMAYLRLLCEAPSSKLAFPAKRAMMDIVDRKFERRLKPVFGELDRGMDAGDKSARLAALFKKLVDQTDDALYEPLVLEFEEFSARFPEYPKADELTMVLGELHGKKGKYASAILAYQKLLSVYPASAFKPRSQRLIGDVLANNLKDYNKAIDAYQEVVNRYADSEEARTSYEQIARIEEQLKQYDLAIDIDEKIVKLYPSTDAALRAYNGEARLLAEQLNRPGQAIETYGKLADMFKASPLAARALKAGAAIAHKQKDFSTELALDERIAKDIPESAEAPEALYAAADICENELQNPEKAIELYNQLSARYPAHKLARKARSRADSLAKKK
ncbi:MAG TPA: tetratricopeptide repeat protein [Elusimicrobiota bacterium]|jgi:tetratricopeptide (TPR) repeat protein|nr:tetratricopeptide repeat protein [Elusimicrobiota bacterium]